MHSKFLKYITIILTLAMIFTCCVSCTEVDEPEPTEAPDVMRYDPIDAPYAADFQVSKVFSSNMVVQRGERLRVFGFADESENGKKVSGEFMGMFAEAVIEDGEWCINFGAKLDANKELGNVMKIYTDTKTVEFENVLVGDVYMVVGQSNIGYSVQDHNQDVQSSKKKPKDMLGEECLLRLFYNSIKQTSKYPERGTDEVCEDVRNGEKWYYPNNNNVLKFSAYGYYFGRDMVIENDYQVPIGIIEIDGNGRELSCFLPNEVADSFGIVGGQSRFMYNHYMYPFARYAIKAIIWYQGESDCPESLAVQFPEKFSAMIEYMRGTHNVTNKNFPVYMVEFPGCWKVSENYLNDGLIRAVIGSIPNTLENSYFCVSSDLWTNKSWANNIHPPIKFEQAERMAKLVIHTQNGKYAAEEVQGPIIEKIELSEDKKTAVLTYTNVGEGLKTADGSDTVKGFKICDKNYSVLAYKCDAKITGPNTIEVTSSTYFEGVAYNTVTGSFYSKDVNLCNSYGMPAAAMFIY